MMVCYKVMSVALILVDCLPHHLHQSKSSSSSSSLSTTLFLLLLLLLLLLAIYHIGAIDDVGLAFLKSLDVAITFCALRAFLNHLWYQNFVFTFFLFIVLKLILFVSL